MRKTGLSLILFGLMLVLSLHTTSAYAQASRTWVSGVGDDVNPCSRTAPCKTFAGAISKTATGGEINCLDPGGFGTVTITKAMTLNCHEVFGSILASFVPGVVINAPATDKVVLRNLQIQGINNGTIGVRILSAGAVSIEDCVVTQFAQRGISDERSSGGTKLFIRNTVVSHNTSTGIASTATGGANNTEIENTSSINNLFGVAAGASNNVTIKRSVFSGNGTGVEADAGGQVTVDNSAISGNGTGVLATSSNIRLSNSDINFNTTQAFSGSPISYGNNRVFGNTSTGSGVTPAGAASSNVGQN